MTRTVGPNSTVALRYRILDLDGELVGASEGDEATEVALGQGDLPDEVEAALQGKRGGDAVRVETSEPFGPHDPAELVSIPLDQIDGAESVQPGDLIPIMLEPEEGDESDEPEEIEVEVVEVNESGIVVDLNHPFAGIDLVFEIEIVSVQ
jgi:FKBP-type peptidyl-prolyl cis-trans isomerase 2